MAAQKQKYGEIINMQNMEISQEGLSLIKKFEGCKLESYQCAAGVWTIGYGSTSGISEGMEISQQRAEALLLEDVAVFEEAVNKAVEVPLEQYEFDALVSWTFNLGPANLNSSTMLKVLNENKKNEVPAQMRRWNKANGETLQGLIRRREAESLLFQNEQWHEV
jgi:lysozyme|tara:strand:- start:5116 stop:5607 length:492 start_codon:yes stop_codon:yes gene_type:complete